MSRKRRKGRLFGWRRPLPGREFHFEVLVSTRWTLIGLATAMALVTLVAASPPTRRARLIRTVVFSIIASGLVALIEGLRGAAFPMLRRVDLTIADLPEGLEGITIGHLTDLHLSGPLTRYATRRGVAAVRAAAPDILVLTGDFISFKRHLPGLSKALAGLSAPHGMYAVFGNHDHWTDLPALERVLRALGITPLMNEHRVITTAGAKLVLAGVDDIWDGQPDLQAALHGAPSDGPIVLLAHSPDYADIAAASPVAVQLAGHTHAGHIRLPWLGPLFLPRHGLLYDRGLHRVGDMWLYVSHGIGGWPIRIGCRAEATVYTLRGNR